MVRLVSSRIHRCYGSNGEAESARNERLNDTIHFISWAFLLLNHNVDLYFLKRSRIIDYIGAFCAFLLVLVCSIDLQAVATAHRLFYKWPKQGYRHTSFWSIPTKVDFLVSLFYLLGSILNVGTIPFLHNSGNEEKVRSIYLAVGSAMCFCFGALVSAVTSIPSLGFLVPGGVARAQNIVVNLFLLGSTFILSAGVGRIMVPTGVQINLFFDRLALVGGSVILIGSGLNYMRVMILLRTVERWVVDEKKGNIDRSPRGLLSWFKSSRSNHDTSDLESDDDDIGFISEDESCVEYTRPSSWTRI